MSYIDEIEYASKNLIELAVSEEKILTTKITLLESAEQKLKVQQWDFQTSDLNDDFSEAYVMNAFARAARTGQEVDSLRNEVTELQTSIGTHQFAIQAICGAILQIVKQGISIVHSGLQQAPNGRQIGSSYLKDIVWQARNQAIHFESGNFHSKVVSLFQELENSFGSQFSLNLHGGKCLAKQIINLLGWQNYDNFLSDARELGL